VAGFRSAVGCVARRGGVRLCGHDLGAEVFVQKLREKVFRLP
jgi:hypothetical protein